MTMARATACHARFAFTERLVERLRLAPIAREPVEDRAAVGVGRT